MFVKPKNALYRLRAIARLCLTGIPQMNPELTWMAGVFSDLAGSPDARGWMAPDIPDRPGGV